MRRMMLSTSQVTLGEALQITFQKVQKYERGTNRIGDSRLQQILNILQVPVSFFFQGVPAIGDGKSYSSESSLVYVSEFLATSNSHALARSFMRIKNPKVRRCIVSLVEEIASLI